MTLKIFDSYGNEVYQTHNAWNAEYELDWSDLPSRHIGIKGQKYKLISVTSDGQDRVVYEVEKVVQ